MQTHPQLRNLGYGGVPHSFQSPTQEWRFLLLCIGSTLQYVSQRGVLNNIYRLVAMLTNSSGFTCLASTSWLNTLTAVAMSVNEGPKTSLYNDEALDGCPCK